MPKSPDELFAFLHGLGIEVVDEDATRRSSRWRIRRRCAARSPAAHTKNLFLKDKKDNYFLVTVDEEAEVDLKPIHQTIGAASRVSFGKPEALMELLGVTPGAVTVFGADQRPRRPRQDRSRRSADGAADDQCASADQ